MNYFNITDKNINKENFSSYISINLIFKRKKIIFHNSQKIL
jgi:hypothetical protein